MPCRSVLIMSENPSLSCIDSETTRDSTLCKSYLHGTLAFAGLLEQICPLEFAWVIGLPVHSNTVECVLESLPRAGINHARLLLSQRLLEDSSVATHLHASVVLIDVCDECDLGSGRDVSLE